MPMPAIVDGFLHGHHFRRSASGQNRKHTAAPVSFRSAPRAAIAHFRLWIWEGVLPPAVESKKGETASELSFSCRERRIVWLGESPKRFRYSTENRPRWSKPQSLATAATVVSGVAD